MKRLPWILAASGLSFSLVLPACTSDDTADDEVGDGDFGDGDSDSGDGDSGDGDGDSGDGDGEPGDCADPNDPDAVVPVDGNITSDTTWSCDQVYLLTPDTLVFVEGAVLTIEPGTTIKGTLGSALVIEKDARIEASGTADAPIVFTSNEASPAPGDWGGLVMLGEAVSNCGESCQAEGFPIPPTYGGTDDSHDCGSLEYVRVEYAGFAISEGNELNGITFYACGSETTVHHVQSHRGLDDGIEMFGGTFDADHVVVTGASDDSLDVDQGFRGTIQHAFIQQNPAVGDACWEISNQGVDFTATPLTSPVFCNATCIGSGGGGEKSKGFNVKEGTEGSWYASIVTNTSNEAGLLADESTYDVLMAGGITLQNNIFFGNGEPEFVSGADSLDDQGWADWIWDASRENLSSDPGLGVDWQSPNVAPTGDVAGSGTLDASCEATSYIGAVDPAGEDWTQAAWINYSE